MAGIFIVPPQTVTDAKLTGTDVTEAVTEMDSFSARHPDLAELMRAPFANIVRQLGGDYAERAGRLDLGRMLFDLEFRTGPKGRVKYRQHDAEGVRWVEGNATPRFFDAVLTDRGTLSVPGQLYGEVTS